MLLRPTANDVRFLALDTSRLMIVVAVAALPAMLWGLSFGEPIEWFVLMIGLALFLAGLGSRIRPSAGARRKWSHGLVASAVLWLAVPAVGAVPLAGSRHYSTWLDAYFDAMSGITTTGLSVVHDLDHLPESLSVWRGTLQFLGGQGIVLAALMFFAGSAALSLYQGEGRDDRIFPSVASTARFIWAVAAAHGVVAISILTLEGVAGLGFQPARAFFHASTVFMAAFDTGGFAPQSTSIAYYRSSLYELVVTVLMIAGAMSFGLHYAIWKRRASLVKDLEVRTIITTTLISITLVMVGITVSGLHEGAGSLRRGLFQALSAHTGTGFATVSTAELSRWSGAAFVGMTLAMGLGGMSSSTAGGIKALRVGLVFRILADGVREALLPDRTVVSPTFIAGGRRRLTPPMARSVMTVTLLYLTLYLLGAAVIHTHGFPLDQAFFESVSASAAVGLSTGVTGPGMPVLVQLTMIFQMWIGRLEFISVFALFGFLVSSAVGE